MDVTPSDYTTLPCHTRKDGVPPLGTPCISDLCSLTGTFRALQQIAPLSFPDLRRSLVVSDFTTSLLRPSRPCVNMKHPVDKGPILLFAPPSNL